jgi:hypothetical protein
VVQGTPVGDENAGLASPQLERRSGRLTGFRDHDAPDTVDAVEDGALETVGAEWVVVAAVVVTGVVTVEVSATRDSLTGFTACPGATAATSPANAALSPAAAATALSRVRRNRLRARSRRLTARS